MSCKTIISRIHVNDAIMGAGVFCPLNTPFAYFRLISHSRRAMAHKKLRVKSLRLVKS